MARIRLHEQEHYEFRYSVTLQPRDINHAGHLGNDVLISLIGAARARLMRSLDLTEVNLGDGRTGIVMGDMAVNYKAEAFMFDELLIETHIEEITRKGFRLFHRVTRGGDLVALVETGVAAFDYPTRKVAPVPERFLRALSALSKI